MDDYILRSDAVQCANDLSVDLLNDRLDSASYGAQAVAEWLKDLPAADVRPDVRPVAEISDAVDEVLDFLNENSNCMPYHIYSALFDLVSGICPNCGADMREEKNEHHSTASRGG